MNLKILKPNFLNIIITILVSIWYYASTLNSILQECALLITEQTPKVYNSYSFLFGKCCQTASLTDSILSLLISILFIPVIYIIISYIISLFKK